MIKLLGHLSKSRTFVLHNLGLRYLSWFIFFLMIFVLMHISHWSLIGNSRIFPVFGDLRAVLLSVECTQTSVDNSLWEDCNYIYGSTLIKILLTMRLEAVDTHWIGFIFVGIFSGILAYVFFSISSLNKLKKFVCICIVVSPPSILLLERGNFDVVMIFLIFLAAITNFGKLQGLSFVLVVSASLLKFYSLPLFAIYFGWKKDYLRFLLVGVTLCFTTYIVFQDLMNSRGRIPADLNGSFGNTAFSLYLSHIYPSLNFSFMSGSLLGLFQLFMTFTFLKVCVRAKVQFFPPSTTPQFQRSAVGRVQVFFILTFLVCYFAGMNYDYRIIFVLIAAVIEINRLNLNGNSGLPLTVVTIFSAWFSTVSGVFQPIGDISLGILVVYFLFNLSSSILKGRTCRKVLGLTKSTKSQSE